MSGEVVFATSFDEKNPPSNIFSDSKAMFWASTGVYPQEIIVVMNQAKPLSEALISGYSIKNISIESCENDSAVKFITQSEKKEVQFKENSIQEISLKFNNTSTVNRIIKIIISDGYGPFCSINKVNFK